MTMANRSTLFPQQDPAVHDPELLRRMEARQKLLDFTTYTCPRYQVDPAHKLIADALDEVVAGKLSRLMIFAPPQVSVQLPALWLARRPDDPVLLCSYGADLAVRLDGKIAHGARKARLPSNATRPMGALRGGHQPF
jgi:hypothetical protein